MLFQSAPPDTSGYMIAGYTVFVVIMVIYLASLFIRRRNLEQDLSTLQTIAADTRPRAGNPPPAQRSAPKTATAVKSPRPASTRKKVTRRK